jgi:hypothetical protein
VPIVILDDLCFAVDFNAQRLIAVQTPRRATDDSLEDFSRLGQSE